MATFQYYALVIPAGFSQLVFRHTSTMVPDELMCTLGVDNAGASMTQTDLDNIAAAWGTNLVDNMDPSITFTIAEAMDAGGVYLQSVQNTAGTNVGAGASLNCAAIIRKNTAQSGRHNRGRMYLPTVQEANIDVGGNLTQGFIDAMDDSMADFEAIVRLNTDGPVILHSKGWNGATRQPEPADPGNALAPTPINSFSCQPKIGTQRRRIR